jgi:hypothetical protein
MELEIYILYNRNDGKKTYLRSNNIEIEEI